MPVELDFSGYTADVKLTGLDPGTDYDVGVSEDRTFTTQSGFPRVATRQR